MKKWFYVITPLILLGVFLSVYLPSREATVALARAKKAQVDADRAAELKHKQEIEEKAREDAAKRSDERRAEEAAKAAEKQAKWDADIAAIQEATAKANREIEINTKLVSDLEIQLTALYKQKDSASREAFEEGREVELAEIDRRNAEWEIQKDVEQIARRARQTLVHEAPAVTVPTSS